MKIKCHEPLNPRYILVMKNNTVVAMPSMVEVDQGIATNNTCQTVATAAVCFGEDYDAEVEKVSLLHVLERYQAALEFDIEFLDDARLKAEKGERLEQIKQNITALHAIKATSLLWPLQGASDGLPDYPVPIQNLLKKKTNIFSMCLSPTIQDGFLRTPALEPVFTLRRKRDDRPFYQALKIGYQELRIKALRPRERLAKIVAESVPCKQGITDISFATIQATLRQKTKELFGHDVDYTRDQKENPVTKDSIEILLGVPTDDVADYVELIINNCSGDLWETIHPDSTFTVENNTKGKNKLIVWTQFFFATVNIFCSVNQLTAYNFGKVLDDSKLSIGEQIPAIVKRALQEGNSVEEALFLFINEHQKDFGLSRRLNRSEMDLIIKKFTDQSRVISTLHELDEFIVFEQDLPGHGVLHQGALCVTLADLISEPEFSHIDTPYFQRVRRQYPHTLPRTASHQNEWLQASFEIDEAELASRLVALMRDPSKVSRAAQLLISDTDDGQKVFQRLKPAVIIALKRNPHWERLKIEVARQLSTPAIQAAFNTCCSDTHVQFQLTSAMAKSIYAVAIESFGPEICPPNASAQELADLLQTFFATDGVTSVTLSAGDGFVLTLLPENVPVIQQLIDRYSNRIYLTPAIVNDIYNEATIRLGEDSAEIIRMNQFDDQANKLREALRLLGIEPGSYIISVPEAFAGYMLATAPLIQQRINDIHHRQSGRRSIIAAIPGVSSQSALPVRTEHASDESQSWFHLTRDMAAKLYLCVGQIGKEDELASLSNIGRPNKLKHTLQLLEIPHTTLRYHHVRGNGYSVMLSKQSQHMIQHILATNMDSSIATATTTTAGASSSAASVYFTPPAVQRLPDPSNIAERRALLRRFIEAKCHGQVPGCWQRLHGTGGLMVGVGKSRYLGLSSNKYYLQLHPDGLWVLDKLNHFARITPETKECEILTEMFSALNQQGYLAATLSITAQAPDLVPTTEQQSAPQSRDIAPTMTLNPSAAELARRVHGSALPPLPALPVSYPPQRAANPIPGHQVAQSLGRFGLHAQPVAARAEPELVVSNAPGEEILKQLISQYCQEALLGQCATIIPQRLLIGLSRINGLRTLIYENSFYLELRGTRLHLLDKTQPSGLDEITDPAQRGQMLNCILLSVPTSILLNIHLRAQIAKLLESNHLVPGGEAVWLERVCLPAGMRLATPTKDLSNFLLGRAANGSPYFEGPFRRIEFQPNGEITIMDTSSWTLLGGLEGNEAMLQRLSDLFVELKEALAIATAEAAVTKEAEPSSSTYAPSF